MFHTVSPQFSLFGMPLVGCVWFCLFWVVFCFLCCFEWLPALPRRRSFLPDLMTVRAVMVCAALEKKNVASLGTQLEFVAYTYVHGIHTYDEINDRLFVNPGRNEIFFSPLPRAPLQL